MKDKLLKVYKTGSKEVKKELEKEFGKDYFITDITERVKSFEDALAILEEIVPDISWEFKEIIGLKNRYAKRLIGEFKLMVIVEALNEGWKPNWNDWNEYKYYPWFFVGGPAHIGAAAGFGTVYSIIEASSTYTYLGSRLCFKTRALAEYAGRTFTALYEQFLLS
jgi:hypothetical protein